MTGLSTFGVVGTILSYDNFLATIKFDLNPPTNGGAGLAVMPISAIPCDVKIGNIIYVVKQEHQEVPVITCKKEEHDH